MVKDNVIRLENRLRWGMVVLIVLITLTAICFTLEYPNQQKLVEINKNRYVSCMLADRLRQSSDDLSRMVRTYVITGDTLFRNQYYQVLNIRNGKQPRPEKYYRVYWDLLSDLESIPPCEPKDSCISLDQLFINAGFTDDEIKLLKFSENESNRLVNLEEEAMNAVNGIFLGTDSSYSIIGNPNREYAINILHGKEYHKAKKSIMKPINEFYDAVDLRTYQEVEKQGNINKAIILTLISLFILSVLTSAYLLYIGRTLHKAVIISLEKQVRQKTKEISDSKIEIEKKNQELITSNTTKDKLFSIISHDLRSPIGTLITTLDFLADEGESINNEMKNNLLVQLSKTSKQTYDLLQNLLFWSRNQMEAISAKPVDIDIHKQVNNIKNLTKDLTDSKSIKIKNEIPQNLIVKTDSNILNLILRNLITNAIKFSPKKTTIHLGIKTEGKKTIIYVKDMGVGMDEKTIKDVLNPMIFKTKSGTNNESGSGLGLKIVKEFVEKYYGKLWIESEPNKGTTVYFSLTK